LEPRALFNWCLGLSAMAIFVGGDFQGSSPLVRGEQENFSRVIALEALFLAIYLLLPRIVGWK
jgi:hypothetical protein